ncbi:hypothetical protein BHM03_00005664 [Ensete ventricosum]|nr:hypothetical protein BHM03_00005664 [Ensete ventricosum]
MTRAAHAILVPCNWCSRPRQGLPSDHIVGPNHVATLTPSAAPAPTPGALNYVTKRQEYPFGDGNRSGVSGNRGSFEPFFIHPFVSGTLASVIACSHYLPVRVFERETGFGWETVLGGLGRRIHYFSLLKKTTTRSDRNFVIPSRFFSSFLILVSRGFGGKEPKGLPPGLLPLFFFFSIRG